jgi:HK97 family phage prohead protease
LKAGEKREDIFLDANGAVKAKLIGPRAVVRDVGDEDSRAIDFVISTESIDRYDSTLSLGGWKLANYRRNPVVLWGHDDCTPAIGRSFNIRTEGGLCSSVEFAPPEVYPLADTIYQLLKKKFLNAASVGFIPLAYQWSNDESRPYGIDFEEQELLEWSVVNIPANPDCLVQARSAGIDCGPIVKWAERALDRGGMAVVSRAELEELRKSAGAPTSTGFRGGRIDWDKIALLPELVTELGASLRAAGAGKRAGKVLSADNEKRLQTAHDHVKSALDHCTAAMDHVKSVIEQNKKDPEADDDADGGPADGTGDDPEQAAAAAAATAAAQAKARETETQRQRARVLKLKGGAAAA